MTKVASGDSGSSEGVDVAGYLARLGLERHQLGVAPSVEALGLLHRAHVERVPYETLEFQLGRPTTVDPYESAARVVAGRGGYCFLLNGAFSLLLAAFGYDVRWHMGGVEGRDGRGPVGANGNHLALSVHGLPAPGVPEGGWLVDVGLGDALYEPIPLRVGRYRQGPFEYRLRRSDVERDGWRLDHDESGGFAGMDFTMAPAGPGDFVAMHRSLSTSPESGFVRMASVQRRHRLGVDLLRGCVLRTVTGDGGRERVLTTSESWFAVLADVFGLLLDDLSAGERERLWSAVWQAHERWRAGAG